MSPAAGRRRRRAWVSMLAVGAAVIALDQATKGALRAALDPGEHRDLLLGFDLSHVTNNGIAFGMLEDASDGAVLVVTLGALALVVVWFAFAAERPATWLGAGLLVGGAVGNLIDRLRLDGVTDFIDPPFWPAFNVADIAITAGVIALALAALTAGKPAAAEEEPRGR